MDLLKQLASQGKGKGKGGATSGASGTSAGGARKYMRRGELKRQQQQQASAHRVAASASASAAATSAESDAAAAAGRIADGGTDHGRDRDSHGGPASLGAAPTPGAGAGAGAGASDSSEAHAGARTATDTGSGSHGSHGRAALRVLPAAEVTLRLRRLGQVVRYFGEAEAARLARLRRHEADRPADSDGLKVGGGHDVDSRSQAFLAQDRRARDVSAALSVIDAARAKSSRGYMAEGEAGAAAGAGAGEGAGAAGTGARARDAASDSSDDSGSDSDSDGGGGGGGGGRRRLAGASKRRRVAAGDGDGDGDGDGGSGSGAPDAGSGSGAHAGAADAASTAAAGAAGGGAGGGEAGGSGAAAAAAAAAGEAEAEAEVDDATYVYRYFRRLLKQWEADLGARSEAERRSAAGARAMLSFKQCKDYLRPFFRMCKAVPCELSPHILTSIRTIVRHCEDREYVRASDTYLQLAIGNAPWPIGVTSVGIHERAARTKIFSNNIAHVLNDERQRKYLTSLKKLMTYAQTRYPSEPSKMLSHPPKHA